MWGGISLMINRTHFFAFGVFTFSRFCKQKFRIFLSENSSN
jgi:hypothetical protein